jgi:chromosome segregation ATPase
MENPVIQTNLAELLQKLDGRFDKLDDRLERIENRLTSLEVNQVKLEGKLEASIAEIRGDIKALDTKVDQLEKRVGNQEFYNRGILIGIIVIVLGGAAKFLGLISN